MTPIGGGYDFDVSRSKNVVSVVQGENEFDMAQPGVACIDVSVPVNNVSATLVSPGFIRVVLGAQPNVCENTANEDFVVFTARQNDGVPENQTFMFAVN